MLTPSSKSDERLWRSTLKFPLLNTNTFFFLHTTDPDLLSSPPNFAGKLKLHRRRGHSNSSPPPPFSIEAFTGKSYATMTQVTGTESHEFVIWVQFLLLILLLLLAFVVVVAVFALVVLGVFGCIMTLAGETEGMSRSWMYEKRTSLGFLNGVEEFCRCALEHQENVQDNGFYCPCVDCENVSRVSSIKTLRDHVIRRGFRQQYHVWIWHGEIGGYTGNSSENPIIDHHVHTEPIDRTEDMFSEEDDEGEEDVDDDIEEDHIDEMMEAIQDKPHLFERLSEAAEKPLYPGCVKYTQLSAVSVLTNLKIKGGVTDAIFSQFLEALEDMFPEGNVLPKSTYYANKLMCPFGLAYEKIDACPNDCILYRKEFADLDKCPRCGKSRYKLPDGVMPGEGKKGPSAKLLWYLPIIPRFRRLFSIKKEAKNLRWHADKRKKDGLLRHPADSPQWKDIDEEFPEFGKEDRNLRLALSTDGMNPFGSLSSQHSTWPVLLVIYNLPPWLCMKSKNIMLSLLIQGPKQPGNDIDVYLAPLIDDLKKMWDEGISVLDAYGDEIFTLRAMLFCTINDYPAYGNLSGYKVKGKMPCPVCEDDMESTWLPNSRKHVYPVHRKWLNRFHPYRKKKSIFDGNVEERRFRRPSSGREVYNRVKGIETVFGKSGKNKKDGIWKKESAFWKLEYWKHLSVRHCLDVMHIEKNVCEAILGTLLNMDKKSKDGIKVRRDMQHLKIRPHLWPKLKEKARKGKGKSYYLPPACYTLSKVEKRIFLECLYGIKVPKGYSSNIRKLVCMTELKLHAMKSHDCHVMMQVLLPIAIRGILPKHVRDAITRLCSFFNTICNKVLDPEELDKLQANVVVTLCQFEMYFPPSFFDIMVHLVVHLVREIKLCGPVFMRWAYPFERHMGCMQRKVRNPARPEASMIQGTVSAEIGAFIAEYMSRAEPIGLPKSRHEGRLEGKGTIGAKDISAPLEKQMQAHLCVLQQLTEVSPYLEKHMQELRARNPTKTERALVLEHNRTFSDWFQNKVMAELDVKGHKISNTIKWLSYGPQDTLHSYEGYDINGYTFHTLRQDKKSRSTQNSGVTMVASSRDYASAKDKNPVDATHPYYGVIQEIWVLDYSGKIKVPLFQCKWAENSRRGVKLVDNNMTIINMTRLRDTSEPFILASQAKQVFYIRDNVDHDWSVVVKGKRYILGVGDVDDEEEYDQFDDSPPFSISESDVLDGTDNDTNYMRLDHTEGITVDEP
ncbi:uncharacterized protein [Spinacia oleracea]|uniref:Transposon protein, putative, CACTA, En/Spm sub-class n=1 Tax=Spinacia oleracea TaxID=3562 RepID=A0ABM3RSB1_SPIOL|nr:uncharacterized protein LOC110780473 [Spinacia oleracea]